MGLVDAAKKALQTISGNSMQRTMNSHGSKTVEAPNNTIMEMAQQGGVTKLAGTTTNGKQAVMRLAIRHGIDAGGYLEIQGKMLREPGNEYDPAAIAVYVEGERIGYLPGGMADVVRLEVATSEPIMLQLFTKVLTDGLRGEVWFWIGDDAPQWEWSEDHWPPLSPEEKRIANHQATEEMLAEAMQEGGSRAEQFRRGSSNGVHYLETVEPIQQLKWEGRLEEALRLCYTAIEGAEHEAIQEGTQPAPWYTEQAAIILRKLKRPHEEEAVLRRWIHQCPPGYIADNPNEPIVLRLNKVLANNKKSNVCASPPKSQNISMRQ